MSNGDTQTDPVRPILDPLSVDKQVKHQAWDAYHNSKTPQEFRAYFDKAQIPQEAKKALWNAKFGGQKPTTPAAPTTPQQPQQQPVDERIAKWAEDRFGQKAEMQAPSWYGATAKYLAGEGVGAGLAVSGAAQGSAKLGYHLLSALAADVNPFISKEEWQAQESRATEDIKNAGKSIASMATSLLKPETYTDPVKFGSEVANIAMTVDGAKKMAESFSGKAGLSPEETAKASSTATDHGLKEAILKPRVHAAAWAQLKGAELGKKFMAARREVAKDINARFDNISKQIDTALPQGSIAVGDLAKTIQDNYAEAVKTPDKMNSALSQLVGYANRIQPGLSPFEAVKQFRTKVFKAMKEGDPQGSVLGKLYDNLSTKLQATASKYGLGKEWAESNKLREQISKYDESTLDAIKQAGVDGNDVLNALKKNKTLTAKIATDLKPFGMKPVEVMKDVKLAEKASKAASGQNYRLFRYAYGAGIPVTIGAKVIGHAGYLPALAAGATTGIAAAYVTALARSLRLHPDILRMLMEEDHLPGRSNLPKGVFPKEETPEVKALPGVPKTPKPSTPPPASTPPAAPAPLPGVEKAPEEPKVTKVAEGQHGTGRIAEQSKGRERAAKGETTPGYERSARAGERRSARAAAMKAPSQAKIDMGQVSPPEMEEFLSKANPTVLSGLKKMLKAGKIDDVTYTESLKHFTIEAYEKLSNKDFIIEEQP